jgi:epoxide hydrolase
VDSASGTRHGDLGAAISPQLGRVAPNHVTGVHLNGPSIVPPVPLRDEELAELSEIERDRVHRIEAFMREEYGYIAIQSTRPQSIAYGLTDSPIGQLAWIMDKFREWTWRVPVAESIRRLSVSSDLVDSCRVAVGRPGE